MKQLLLFAVLLSLAIPSIAKDGSKRPRSFRFYINTSADYNLKGTISNNTIGTTGLSSKNFIGGSIGGAILLQNKRGLFMNAGLNLKYSPSTVSLNYRGADMGMNTIDIEQEYEQRTTFLSPNIMLGYAFLRASATSGIDIGAGIHFNIPLNGNNDEGQTLYNKNTNGTTDLILVSHSKWGKKISKNYITMPIQYVQYNLQVAYRVKNLLPNNTIRMGINYYSNLFPSPKDNKTITIYYFDKKRNEIGTSSFENSNTNISFFIGLSI